MNIKKLDKEYGSNRTNFSIINGIVIFVAYHKAVEV